MHANHDTDIKNMQATHNKKETLHAGKGRVSASEIISSLFDSF